MSRIGKIPVEITSGVTAKLNGNVLDVSGKAGTLKHKFNLEGLVAIKVDGNKIAVTRTTETQRARTVQGLTRAIISNMIEGASKGYTKILDIVGVGYKAELKGDKLVVNAGYSHSVEFPIAKTLKVMVDKQTRVTITGADKWLVGETAARIRKIRKPEPYQGKGIRYSNEVIKRKVGKTAAGPTGGGK